MAIEVQGTKRSEHDPHFEARKTDGEQDPRVALHTIIESTRPGRPLHVVISRHDIKTASQAAD